MSVSDLKEKLRWDEARGRLVMVGSEKLFLSLQIKQSSNFKGEIALYFMTLCYKEH